RGAEEWIPAFAVGFRRDDERGEGSAATASGGGVGIEADELAVAQLAAGEPADEAPMRHHGDAVPVGHAARGDAKGAAALAEQELAFLGVRPPAFRDMVEVEMRPALGQKRALAADVADEGAALAHQGRSEERRVGKERRWR